MSAPSEPQASASDLARRQAALAAINEVIDPCSQLNGSHLGLVDLGLVKDVCIKGRTAQVTLLLDDPVCIYTFVIQHEIREALHRHGIDDVEVGICADQLWTADRLSHYAAVRLGRTPARHGEEPSHRPTGRGTRQGAE